MREGAGAIGPDLDALVHRLRDAAGDNLLGVALYGGLAKGRYTPGISDVNLLLVVKETRLAALSALAVVLTAARRSEQASFFIVSRDELALLARIFPVKIQDIATSHRVLYGDPYLQEIAIDARKLGLRTLQEITNLELRLRQRVLERGGSAEVAWRELVRSLPKLAILFEAVLRSRGAEIPTERSEILIAAGKLLQLPSDTVETLARVHRHAPRPSDEDVQRALGDYLELLSRWKDRLAAEVEP